MISTEPVSIPRSAYEKADYLSRIVDRDDWYLNPIIFRWLECLWGRHTIDRFTDDHNHQLERFDSRFWNPSCEAMDTFVRCWDLENNWLFLPLFLIPRIHRHLRSRHAKGSLVIPLWRSTPYWPLEHCARRGFILPLFVID